MSVSSSLTIPNSPCRVETGVNELLPGVNSYDAVGDENRTDQSVSNELTVPSSNVPTNPLVEIVPPSIDQPESNPSCLTTS